MGVAGDPEITEAVKEADVIAILLHLRPVRKCPQLMHILWERHSELCGALTDVATEGAVRLYAA